MIDAYLDIHRLRMRSRLEYAVIFPADLLNVQVASMILLTLVENALKHGVSPLLEGGFVRVSALAKNQILELRVADSGHEYRWKQKPRNPHKPLNVMDVYVD